ncbi:hypothetical protein PoB_003717500 [Plakobranchus ocellatus]|uniref:Uncharacterized protein n=1 Tax=Plakobranchus ocellatus TaxID=259542 RepID=A0AAV4ATM8_9GAST|nr:hypothetical protein PoB_003717500 [Plakobranchus ocellatus]
MKSIMDAFCKELNSVPADSDGANSFHRDLDDLSLTLELHQRKGQIFYDRKKGSQFEAQRGENKNWTILSYLYHMVHIAERFESVNMHFPIRGHSFMECDRDMASVSQTAKAEAPEDWRNVLQTGRSTPELFHIIKITGDKFLKCTKFL